MRLRNYHLTIGPVTMRLHSCMLSALAAILDAANATLGAAGDERGQDLKLVN